jgi:hypothetical protein
MFDGTGPGSLQATCTDILVSRTNSLELRPADHDRPDKSAVLILVHNRKNSDYFTLLQLFSILAAQQNIN